jgi:hypothetical protein
MKSKTQKNTYKIQKNKHTTNETKKTRTKKNKKTHPFSIMKKTTIFTRIGQRNNIKN